MKTISIPLTSLTIPPWEVHLPDPTLEHKLEVSLTKFGQLRPLVVRELPDGQHEIVDGKHLYEAMQRLGWTEATVLVTTAEPVEVAMALSLVHTFDYPALARVVAPLSDEVVSTSPFSHTNLRHYRTLARGFDWKQFAEVASQVTFFEGEDGVFEVTDVGTYTDQDTPDPTPRLNKQRPRIPEMIQAEHGPDPEPAGLVAPVAKAVKAAKGPKVKAPPPEIAQPVAPAARRMPPPEFLSPPPSTAQAARQSGGARPITALEFVQVDEEPPEAPPERPGASRSGDLEPGKGSTASPRSAPLSDAPTGRSKNPDSEASSLFSVDNTVFLPSASVKNWRPQEPPTLDGVTTLGFDTEGTGVKWWAGDRPIGISIAYGANGDRHTQYLPWGHRGGGNLDEAAVRTWAERELRGKHLVGANIRYDVHMMREWGVDLEAQGCTFSDVQHRAALLDEYRRKFNLEALCEEFLPEQRKGKLDEGGQNLDKSRMAAYHAGDVYRYAENDSASVLDLVATMQPLIDAEELGNVLALENAVIPVVCEMEKNSALIDRALLKKWVIACREKMQEILWDLSTELGFGFNPEKNDDWQRMFQYYGIPVEAHTEKGAASFTDTVLAAITHPRIQLARRVGKLSSLRSKFLDAYDEVIGDDCLLRFALHQLRGDEYGTIRGRFSMSSGGKSEEKFGANLQQVFSVENQREAFGIDRDDASFDDEIYLIRRLFISHEDGVYLASDAQSIEYRLAAHFAGAKHLLDAYQEDWKKIRDPRLRDGKWVDFHKVVQDIVTPYKAIGRKTTKNLNFCKIYGGKVKRVAETLRIPLPEAQEIVDIYDDLFPEFKTLYNKAMNLARDRGYVKTLLGRRARFPDDQKQFCHAALNYVVQGSAADIMKQKLVELHAQRKYTGFVMRQTVHDEVDGDAMQPETEQRVLDILNTQSFKTKVPIVWKVTLGPNWAAC